MDKIKNTLKFIGKMADNMYEHNQKVTEMTQQLMRKGHNLDLETTKQIAGILVNQAEVTWKN